MKLGTHMPGGERRKPVDIEDRRTKVKEKRVPQQNSIIALAKYVIRN
jgi:hypothetical protein